METKKQTAVEWLALYIKGITTLNCDDIIEKALEMEKEQIIKAYKRESAYMKHAGCTDEQIDNSAINYYNKTFKSE